MFEMDVEGIMLDSGWNQPLVILSDLPRHRALPIRIGPTEAAAIARTGQGTSLSD